uniref:Uncharacterized protein n=1 Tax=Arundo donax TaxID=35708 RepID=A0A0A8YCV9_ARUDO
MIGGTLTRNINHIFIHISSLCPNLQDSGKCSFLNHEMNNQQHYQTA